MNATGIVDAHHHVWQLAVRDQDWIKGDALAPLRRDFTLADLRAEAEPAGVSATVVVQTVTVADETPELLAMAAGDDLVAGVVGWVDLTAPEVADTLAALREGAGGEFLVGIRHSVQSEADPDWLCRPDVRRGLSALADAGLTYDLLVLPHQLPAAIRVAEALPELTLVLDHLGKPPIAGGRPEPWATSIRTLATHPNVTCKLSGMVTEADWASWTIADLRPYADIVLDAFGPDRLMFGSDWPVCLLAATYADILATAEQLTSGLNDDETSAVLGGTATRSYRL
ncbi:amidohydrolase family protein [Actinoallomurus purpureus]|uniref:amidohydrolase family protein n=1 Tax=Actinoallomurus purpureus TaxID=478114 RepID=UPI002092D82E|nr:amidohydrolase family protein [Actinoallomurus purpureus]MCO6007979.1 amidohydrolase family protein [Actinoallomurus purpureus]